MCTVFPTPPQKNAICPNETVGAVPMCPPERPRSGVSIQKKHTYCMRGIERRMRPCGATRAGTQAPPLPNSIIFFHAILHKQKNHLRVIHPNGTNRLRAILPKRNRRGGACVPARTFAQRRFHAKNRFVYHALCVGILTADAPLQGDAGGHTGTAPTHLHHIFPHNPIQTK